MIVLVLLSCTRPCGSLYLMIVLELLSLLYNDCVSAYVSPLIIVGGQVGVQAGKQVGWKAGR